MIDEKGSDCLMEKKKYQWNQDRLTAFLVVLGNLLVFGYVSVKMISDNYFFKNQFGITGSIALVVRLFIALSMMLIIVFLNYQFLKKHHMSRMILAGIQTILMAFILRNLLVVLLFDGVQLSSMYMNVIELITQSVLIYATLFSERITSYFNLMKKKES